MREADAVTMCELNLRAQYGPGYESIPNAQMHTGAARGHKTLYPFLCGSPPPARVRSPVQGGPPAEVMVHALSSPAPGRIYLGNGPRNLTLLWYIPPHTRAMRMLITADWKRPLTIHLLTLLRFTCPGHQRGGGAATLHGGARQGHSALPRRGLLTHAGEWMESIWRVLVGGGAYSWDTLGELLWRRPARLVQESSKLGGYVTCSFPCMCMNESMICAAVRAGSLGQGHVWNFVFIHAACNMMDICNRIALSGPCACA